MDILALARLRLRDAPRVGLTRRGVSVLVAGLLLVAIGMVLGLPDVVGLGAAPLLAVGASAIWMSVGRLDRGRGALRVARRLQPNPAVRGQVTTARLVVTTAHGSATARGRLTRLRISEQAARELCDQDTLRARVAAQPERIAVRYRLTPLTRGRWTLGPLLTSRVDLFGLVRATQPLGATSSVAVWPHTVDLPVRQARALGEHERAATGARLASTDDTVLRDYVTGDDPRRVHWASAARRGQLMVRSDESAGMPPVTVLLDQALLPPAETTQRADDGEWAVECATSIALSLHRVGHPVRLVPTSQVPVLTAGGFSARGGSEGRAHILNQTLDIRGPRNAAEADHALVTTAKALVKDRRAGEVTIGVLGPMRPASRRAVAALAGDGPHWALLVDAPTDSPDDLLDTAQTLRTAGWRVVVIDPSTGIEHAWARLVDGVR